MWRCCPWCKKKWRWRPVVQVNPPSPVTRGRSTCSELQMPTGRSKSCRAHSLRTIVAAADLCGCRYGWGVGGRDGGWVGRCAPQNVRMFVCVRVCARHHVVRACVRPTIGPAEYACATGGRTRRFQWDAAAAGGRRQ